MNNGPNKAWLAGQHVQVDSLRAGQRFIAYDGQTYTYERIDGALSGVHHANSGAGNRASFAGRAHVVPLFEGAEPRRCGLYECPKGATNNV